MCASGMGTASRGYCGIAAVAVSFSIVQAFIWLIFAVIALLLRGCYLDVDINWASYVLVAIYFYNPKCASERIPWGGMKLPTTTRTDAVTYYFLVTSALRLVTGIALLRAMVMASRRGGVVSRTDVLFRAWAVLVGACLVGDFICGIIYATDIGKFEPTLTLELCCDLVYTETLENISLAPVMMMMFCFRWGVFWLAEVVMFPAALRVFLKDRKEEKWLLRLSTSTVAGSTPPSVAVPWVTGGSGAGGSDVVRQPGGSDERGPHSLAF